MPLLSLADIGKIYVSEGNVSVGIRGVDLSFEKGEFVAITGKSGSGKSTLLNIISGTDTYEEGELYIEGQSTSHYLQPDWEEYREKYISFIYQDYNIIESFTVLENVELSLMHIEDRRERRARALELLDRVGLSSHVHHKGSKLSGGQKQRTVIARALAKDSPIILADEPTGNLDSVTSSEIIKLLSEVSKDKLLIVVTHDFDEVESYATRHIRIFDGAVEFDHKLKYTEVSDESREIAKPERKSRLSKEEIKKTLRNGTALGRAIFTAKPKLSVFICLLMLIGTLGIFAATTLLGGTDSFGPDYMFTHIDGRVVVAKPSGEVISQNELDRLVDEYGAVSALRCDSLLDEGGGLVQITLPLSDDYDTYIISLAPTYNENFGEKIIGRYPEAVNEVFLYLPISYRDEFGKKEIKTVTVDINGAVYNVVGLKYYYDNNITPRCLFTEDGFRVTTAYSYIVRSSRYEAAVSVFAPDGSYYKNISISSVAPSFAIEKGKIYIDNEDFNQSVYKGVSPYENADFTFNLSAFYMDYDYIYGSTGESMSFESSFGKDRFTDERPSDIAEGLYHYEDITNAYISSELFCEIFESVLDKSYKQVSLFFENDNVAREAGEKLQEAGYIAVPSYTTYQPSGEMAILNVIIGLIIVLLWCAIVVFLAFFVNICSSRALGAFKSDVAIMRSMGIQVKVIVVGMYVRMLLSLIPAFLFVAAVAVTVFTVPAFNEFFTYLYWWQYLLIFVGMIALTMRTTHKQIKALFGESVKKSLKGGANE